MTQAYIGIGGNLGRRELFLSSAKRRIEEEIGPIVAESSIYETAAWGMENAPDFLNQVIAVSTELAPKELLQACFKIERFLGRKRNSRAGYASRTADLDILHMEGIASNEVALTLPHPNIAKRRFVLVPFSEIAPHLQLPGTSKSIADLLDECEDYTEVTKWDYPTAI